MSVREADRISGYGCNMAEASTDALPLFVGGLGVIIARAEGSGDLI